MAIPSVGRTHSLTVKLQTRNDPHTMATFRTIVIDGDFIDGEFNSIRSITGGLHARGLPAAPCNALLGSYLSVDPDVVVSRDAFGDGLRNQTVVLLVVVNGVHEHFLADTVEHVTQV